MDESFYIGATQIEQPDGWEKFEYKINRDDSIRFIGVSTPLELVFRGTGYDTLVALATTNGRAYIAEFSVVNSRGQTIYSGSINLTEGEHHIETQSWKTKIRDGNFSSYIYAHRELKVNTSLAKARDTTTTITPVSPFNLTFPAVGRTSFIEQSVFDHGVDFQAFDLHDVMTYLVTYISNGTLSFQSDWYDALPNTQHICLVVGREMTMLTNDPLLVSIQDIMDSVGRLYNLFLSAEGSTIRLEPESYFFDTTTSITIDSIRNTVVRFDELSLLREIKIGDPYVDQSMCWTPERDDHHVARNCFMDTNSISDATIDLQPTLVSNGAAIISAFHESIGAITQLGHEYVQGLGGRELNNLYKSGYVSAGFWVDWMIDKIGLVQYTASNNTVTTVEEDSFTYCNEQFRNTNVLARYNFGGNIYAQPREFNSFRMEMENGYMSAVFDNTEVGVDFYDSQTELPQVEIEGGEHNGESPVYSPIFVNEYVAPAAETKSFTIGVHVPQYVGGGTEADLYNPHPYTDANALGTSNSKQNVTINVVLISGTSTILAMADYTYWENGDNINVNFQNGSWASYSGTYTITAIDPTTKIVTINFDASPTGANLNESDFVAGDASADISSGNLSFTAFDLILRIKQYNSSGVLQSTHTETITDASFGRTYTTTTEFTLSANDIVGATVEFDSSTVGERIVFLPVVWRDNSESARELITISQSGFRGFLLECDTVLNTDQINTVLAAPHLAVQLPNGKAWIDTMDVERINGRAKLTLITNSTYYDGIA